MPRQHRKENARRWLKRAHRPGSWFLVALSVLWVVRSWVNGPYPPWRAGLSAAALAFSLGLLVVAYAPSWTARRKVIAVGAAGLVAATTFSGAGGLQYTYGSDGKLSLSYSLQASDVAVGVNASLVGISTLTNVGSSTVRIAPALTVEAVGPGGTPYLVHDESCPLASRTPFDDRAYMEIAAGASRSFTLSFGVHWGSNASASAPPEDWMCKTFILNDPGTYQITAGMSSGPLFEHTTLPVWTGIVTAPLTSFTAS